jgi:hypothetical protein
MMLEHIERKGIHAFISGANGSDLAGRMEAPTWMDNKCHIVFMMCHPDCHLVIEFTILTKVSLQVSPHMCAILPVINFALAGRKEVLTILGMMCK